MKRERYRSVCRAALVVAMMVLAQRLSAQPPFLSPADPVFTVRNLKEINSTSDDYAPFVTPNGEWLYFTSSRQKSSDLYRSVRRGSMTDDPYGPAEAVPDDGVNTRKDDGVLNVPVPPIVQLVSFNNQSAITSAMQVVTGVMASGRRARSRDAELYSFTMSADGSSITNFRALTELNSKKWDSQPCISSDGSFIIFTSTRKGGEGGKDLWISYRQGDGTYGMPTNLGDRINSGDDEISPFISPDGQALFFASDGHKGEGGFDIFLSRKDMEGNWGEPENLGRTINTKANELFFYGASRTICYFVSDRDGGMGGLDIYEGSFNPFMPGYGNLRISIVDTTYGQKIGGHVEVVEKQFGTTLGRTDFQPEQGGSVWLYAGYPHEVTVKPVGFDTTITIRLDRVADEERRDIVIKLATPPPPPPPPVPVVMEPTAPPTPPGPPPMPPDGPAIMPPPPPPPPVIALDFQGINVPLFVSGYYRLNTLVGLEDLKKRQESGDLGEADYIENVAENSRVYDQYRKMALDVESILGDFYRRSINEYFPAFDTLREDGEYLVMTVYGFADPRPVYGTFEEDMDVTFETENGQPFTMRKGSEMDNFRLAGLRAFFAVQYLDKLFRDAATQGHDEYVRLRNQGAVRWRIVSGSVDEKSGKSLADKRRIHVTIQRLGGEES